MFNLKIENSKNKEAPYTKEQYDYILTDLLNRKQAAMAGSHKGEDDANKKAKAFSRLIDSIWKEQYTYYKK